MKSKKYSSKKSNVKPFVTDKKVVSDFLEKQLERTHKPRVEECPCCVNDCKCCTHPSGTVGHKCSYRCHS